MNMQDYKSLTSAKEAIFFLAVISERQVNQIPSFISLIWEVFHENQTGSMQNMGN